MTPFQQTCLGIIRADLSDTKVNGVGWLRPSYVMAHIETECDWEPRPSTDGRGSRGPMQVLPTTARQMGVTGDQSLPTYSILAGMRYLSACRAILTHWFGEVPAYILVCAAYNEGPGNVERGRSDTAYVARWTAAQRKWAFVDQEVANT